MAIAEYCNREVVIVEATETVMEAAILMRAHHVGDVVVVEKRDNLNFPVGILTDRDIVMEVLAQAEEPSSVIIGDVMSRDLIMVREQDDLMATIKLMCSRGIRRMPVVDDEGVLLGILTVDDVLELITEQMFDLANLVTRERHRESKIRT